jgi:hypothetical protein
MHAPPCICMYVYVRILMLYIKRIHTCTYSCIRIYTKIQNFICVCVCVCVHKTHTHTHTHNFTTEFQGMDSDLLVKVLRILESQGKATLLEVEK